MNRITNFLVWNVRGLNSQQKWDALRDKINESNASVVCLQETKRNSFDRDYIRKFVLGIWINLNTSPQMVPRVGCLLYGIRPGTMAHSSNQIPMQSQFDFDVVFLGKFFTCQTSMAPVLTKWILSIGYITSTLAR